MTKGAAAASREASGRRFIGVDLGGTQVRAALVEQDGRIVAADRQQTDVAGGPAAVIGQIQALVRNVQDREAVAIGIGVPGIFDGATGTVLAIPALPGWAGIPLAGLMEESSGLPCVLENDATAAAIGEWRAGAGRGCANCVYVTISTGIGAGIVVDNRVMRGVGGLAGEIGHMRITDQSEVCSCGQVGCWEAVASGTALGRAARRLVANDPDGAVARLAAGGPASGRHLGAAARQGDASALALLSRESHWLAIGFVNIQHLYAPERIIVGGGVASLFDLLRAEIEPLVAGQLLGGLRPASLVLAELGDDAGLVGAALQARYGDNPP